MLRQKYARHTHTNTHTETFLGCGARSWVKRDPSWSQLFIGVSYSEKEIASRVEGFCGVGTL